jgi:hypothetical protein
MEGEKSRKKGRDVAVTVRDPMAAHWERAS